jgi:hypothetical protein
MAGKIENVDAPVGRLLVESDWNVRRFGSVDELAVKGEVRYRVRIWDAGRTPFLVKWFNDPAPAADFLERVEDENTRESVLG